LRVFRQLELVPPILEVAAKNYVIFDNFFCHRKYPIIFTGPHLAAETKAIFGGLFHVPLKVPKYFTSPLSLSLSHVSHTNIPRELPPPASALCCCHCPQPPQPPSTASPLRVVRGLGHQARRMPAALLLRLGRTSHPISSTGRVGHRQLPAP
jgi:hypothetical protein